jgi:hypothetical protein
VHTRLSASNACDIDRFTYHVTPKDVEGEPEPGVVDALKQEIHQMKQDLLALQARVDELEKNS